MTPRRLRRPKIDKAELIAALLTVLERDREQLREQATRTRLAATHEESRPENDKDTRGLEASYLARGQAARVEETEEAITKLKFFPLAELAEDDEVTVGAVVALLPEDGDAEELFFIVPVGGGVELGVTAGRVRTITPASPLGRAMVGKAVGDEVVLRAGTTLRRYEITRVA